MKRLAVLALVLVACSDAREHDCKILRPFIPTTADESKLTLWDTSLGSADYRDPDVKAAVKELTGENEWKMYAPAKAVEPSRFAKLRKLCNIP